MCYDYRDTRYPSCLLCVHFIEFSCTQLRFFGRGNNGERKDGKNEGVRAEVAAVPFVPIGNRNFKFRFGGSVRKSEHVSCGAGFKGCLLHGRLLKEIFNKSQRNLDFIQLRYRARFREVSWKRAWIEIERRIFVRLFSVAFYYPYVGGAMIGSSTLQIRSNFLVGILLVFSMVHPDIQA